MQIQRRFLWFFSVSTLLFLGSCQLPEPIFSGFEGKLVYTVIADPPQTPPDGIAADSSMYQIIYAKNSVFRIDNYTPFGKQTYLEDLEKKKSYILIQMGNEKYAIVTDEQEENAPKSATKYKYKYKLGKKELAGIKAPNIKVIDTNSDTTLIMNYYPDISPKYSTAMEGFPGLPVYYSVSSKGIWYTYQLEAIKEKSMNNQLFSIPSDYKIITFNEFYQLLKNR